MFFEIRDNHGDENTEIDPAPPRPEAGRPPKAQRDALAKELASKENHKDACSHKLSNVSALVYFLYKATV